MAHSKLKLIFGCLVALVISTNTWAAPAFDYYEVLELAQRKHSLPSEIQANFRRLVKRYHPDNPESRTIQDAPTKLLRIYEAYKVLTTPDLRAEFDTSNTVNEQRTSEIRTGFDLRQHPFAAHEDPTGIKTAHHQRVLGWRAEYRENLRTLSPQEAILAVLEGERRSRPESRLDDVARGQIEYSMHLFLNEAGMLQDFFYGPNAVRPSISLAGPVQVATAQALAVVRGPTASQIERLHRAYSSKTGSVFVTAEAVKNAGTRQELHNHLHHLMRDFYGSEYLYIPYDPTKPALLYVDGRGALAGMKRAVKNGSLRSTAGAIQSAVTPAMARLYPPGTTFAAVVQEFMREKLNLIFPSDRTIASHMIAILGETATEPEVATVNAIANRRLSRVLGITGKVEAAGRAIQERICKANFLR